MASEGVNMTEDAEMAECDGDKVVTMMDVLQEQQDFEEDANAVLGASDDKNCTYAKGYIKRQALYACLTCCTDAKTDPTKRAGVCLACSLNCHENHELVELYTKRNFRCDCGNPKFNSHPCQFTPNKPDCNDDNIYNQNFSGLYCVCQRPYPDSEASFEDDMIQCIICEDWLHASHLDTVVPANDQYSEMICKGCMEKNEFLHDYSKFAVNLESDDVDVLTVNGEKSAVGCNGDVVKEVLTNGKVEEQPDLTTAIPNGDTEGDTEMAEEKVSSDKSGNNVDAENDKSDESQPAEAKEIVEKDDETLSTVENKSIEGKRDVTTESKQTSDNKLDETSVASDSQVPKDEESKEIKSEDEKGDANKTEDQLLDDIRSLTSDNAADEVTKPITEDTKETESSTMEDNNSEKPDQSTEQSNNENSSTTNPVPETNNSVSDKKSEEDNNDEKSDSVMDAIDALLKEPAETYNDSCENKQTSDELATSTDDDKANDNEMNESKVPKNTESTDAEITESENKQTSDELTTSTDDDKANDKEINESKVPENTESTDVEMTENKSQDEAPADKTETPDKSINEDKDDNKTSATDKNNVVSNENKASNETENTDKPVDNTSENTPSENKVCDTLDTVNENKRKLSIEAEGISPKKAKLDKCIRPRAVKKVYKGATFWPSNFRQKLCTCCECISMYKDLHVLFLTDPDDTVSAYESLGKENVDGGASQYEKGLQALSSLDRIQQINALTEYNKMRDKLLDFLKSFKDRKEIVKEEDIKAFFAGMKPRREPDGVYFCR